MEKAVSLVILIFALLFIFEAQTQNTCAVPYTGQALSNGVTFQILELNSRNYLSAGVINWSNNPTALMFQSTTPATFTFPYVYSENGGHMGNLVLPGTGTFDLDGGHGGILTVSSSPMFYINFIPDGNGMGGVSIKGVQYNYQSNQYPLDLLNMNGESLLSYGNINAHGSYRVYLCSVSQSPCYTYPSYSNEAPNGDYHNAAIDQSYQYGGWTDNCCTRVYLPSGVDPAQACSSDAQCKGYGQSGYWATLKNTQSLQAWNGFTAYLKGCAYQTYSNQVPNGDYHNAAIDQSYQYGGWTDNCCTRVYLPSGVDPAQACASDPLCGGYALGTNWATLKNTKNLVSSAGWVSYLKVC